MIFRAKQSQCVCVLNQHLEIFSTTVTFSSLSREWSLCRTIQSHLLAQITSALVPVWLRISSIFKSEMTSNFQLIRWIEWRLTLSGSRYCSIIRVHHAVLMHKVLESLTSRCFSSITKPWTLIHRKCCGTKQILCLYKIPTKALGVGGSSTFPNPEVKGMKVVGYFCQYQTENCCRRCCDMNMYIENSY